MEDVTEGVLRDGAYVFAAPLRPSWKGLAVTGAVAAGTGILMGYDRKISRSVQHSKRRQLKRWFKDLDEDEGIERFGRSSGVMVTCLSFYGVGVLANNSRAKRTAFIGVEAWLFNELATQGLKQLIGRERPANGDPYHVDAFTKKSSMPSGHTSTAFCLASVIATEYDNRAVDIAAYGIATTVGLSRLYRDVHWASDILPSAALGIAIGKATGWMYRRNPHDWSVIVGADEIQLVRRF